MKAVTVRVLRDELKSRPANDVLNLCMRLARFKKENKELLTYLLFESEDEETYVLGVKSMIDERFSLIEEKGNYAWRKKLQAILRVTKKFIRYSDNKETEVALLLYFCTRMKQQVPHMQTNRRVHSLYLRQVEAVKKKMKGLHEDLQYDYSKLLNTL